MTSPPTLRHSILAQWDINDLFSKTGYSHVRYNSDVDGDGTNEIVCNVGGQSHFAAIRPDGTIVWQNEIDTTQHQGAYFPKIRNGVLYYGDRSSDKVYAIRLSDGQKLWESAAYSGLSCLTICDKGVAIGYTNAVNILDYSDGTSIGGNWPVNPGFTPHEQILAAGDLDQDGNDEIFCNDTGGRIKAIDNDGSSILFTIASSHGHTDMMAIDDIDGDGDNELVLVVDDDDSEGVTKEGDEIVLYDKDGNQIDKYDGTSGGTTFRVGNIGDNGRIAFCHEGGTGKVGVLDANLDELWTVTGFGSGNPAGQISIGDIDGDGQIEILINTDENASAGFQVYDKDGNYIGQVDGYGWISDKSPSLKNGQPFTLPDVNGDGKSEYIGTHLTAANTGSNEMIYLNAFKIIR